MSSSGRLAQSRTSSVTASVTRLIRSRRPSRRRSPAGAPRCHAWRARGCRARGSSRRTRRTAAGACGRSSAQSCRPGRGPVDPDLPVLGDQRLGARAVALVARAAGRLLMRLIADVVGQLNLHRPLDQPLGQLGQQPAGPGDLLLGARAVQQLVDHLIADPPVGRHPESLPQPAAASRALDGLVDQLARQRPPIDGVRGGRAAPRCPAPISARSRSLRSSPGNPGAIPAPRASNPGPRSNTLLLFWVVLLLVVVGIAISFARAYTNPRTIPARMASWV